MSESVRVSEKRSETAKEEKESQSRKSNCSQPVNSSADRILFLQRTIGNQAVGRLIKSGALQAKSKIEQPDDIHEQKAEPVGPFFDVVQQTQIPSRIQRQLYPPIPIIVPPLGSAPVEVNAVDARQETGTPWYAPWRYTGPMANFFRGDVTMTNVESMVINVTKFLRGRSMHRLNVMDHGNENGVEIGDDWIQTPADVGIHSGNLSKLSSRFAGGAFVHMQNCNSGQNRGLICALARAFGAPVYAGTGMHNPLLGFNFGDYVRCDPNGNFNPNVGRPQTPTPPPPADMIAGAGNESEQGLEGAGNESEQRSENV